MHYKRLLISLFAVILLPVILFAATLVLLSATDLSQHRDTIAEYISKIAGRRLSLNGELDLKIASTSSLVVTDITLANAAWSSTAEMIVVQRIEAEIELLPLLRGDLHIPRFHLEGVKMLLETDARGSGNWVLAGPVDDELDINGTGSTTGLKLPWIGDMFIGKVEITHLDAQTGKEITAKLEHARIHADKPETATTIDIVGQVNSHPVEINGKLALPTRLTAANVNVPIELHARVLGLEAEATGSISGNANAPAIDLNVHADAVSLEQLRQVFGDVVPQVKPVKLVMEAKGEQGGPVSFMLNVTAGKGKLGTELTLRRDGQRPSLTGTVAISDVDVERLWEPFFAEESVNAAVAEIPTPASAVSQGLDQPIPLVWLESLDANVLLSAKRINLPQTRINSLQSRFIIDDRILKIDELELITDAGTIMTTLVLDVRDKQVDAQLGLKTTVIALGKLPPLAGNKRFTDSRAEAEMSLTSQGETIAGLIENLEGDIQLDYDNQQRKEKLSINLTRKAEQKTENTSRLVVTADGHIDKQAIELRGHIIPPVGLLSSNNPHEIDLAFQGFGVKGKITGTAAVPYTLEGLDLGVEAQADDFRGLRQVFGQDIPEVGKTDISARLKTQQSKLQLSNLHVGLGEGQIDGWLTLDTSTSIPHLQAELAFTDLNLDNLMPEQDQQAQVKQQTAVKPEDDKVFSDEPLPFENLSQANFNVVLRVNNLMRNNRHLNLAKIKIDLAEGRLSAYLLELSSVKGELEGIIVIDASGKDAPSVTLKLKAPHIELGELIIADDGTAAVEGPLAMDIFLQGRGNSVAQIMATLNGNVNLLMEQGSADAKRLDLVVGGLSAMLGTIFIEQSSKTQIKCAICDLKFAKGILTPQLAVLDTQYSTVFAEGQVDLKQEKFDIKVSPNAKGVTLSVAFPVLLKGTLSKPSMEVEKTGALLKAGELWATVVYPPAALLKFSDLGDGKPNPCVSMVAEKAGIPIIKDVGKAVGGVVKGVGSAVKGVGSGLGKFVDAVKAEGDSQTTVDEDVDDGADKATSDDLDDPDLFMDY